jgi:hypothetical protein
MMMMMIMIIIIKIIIIIIYCNNNFSGKFSTVKVWGKEKRSHNIKFTFLHIACNIHVIILDAYNGKFCR